MPQLLLDLIIILAAAAIAAPYERHYAYVNARRRARR
jgi:hypothetical protein